MKLRDYLAAQLKGLDFKRKYDALWLEYVIKQLLIDLRTDLKAIVSVLMNRFKTK